MNSAVQLTPQQREAEDRVIKEGYSDFRLYAERYLKIRNKKSQLVPFRFNKTQQILEQIYDHATTVLKLAFWAYILKARQEGVSTWFTARGFFKTVNNYHVAGIIVTHEPDATDNLFGMQKRYLDHLPNEIRPRKKFNNKKQLEFNTPDGKGLDSSIRVGTAEKPNIGSGQTINWLHLSEVAKYPRTAETALITSLLQAVPDGPDSMVLYESTAQGIGGEFYNGFWACRHVYEIYLDENHEPQFRYSVNEKADPNNKSIQIFVPWYAEPEYAMPIPEGFKRTEKEERMVKRYNLTDEQLQWRRVTIQNKCKGSEDEFMQEYPSNPREAFLSSGRPAFDNVKVEQYMLAAPPPIARYEILSAIGQFIANPEGRLKVWKEPVANRPYVISGDVAEGLEHGDFHSASVWDHYTGEQVAHWHGHCSPTEYAMILIYMGRRYNDAWLVPERNNHGIAVVEKLLEMKYKHIYVEKIVEPPHKPRKRYGFLTAGGRGGGMRQLVLDTLIEAVNNGTHGIKCREAFEEMLSFKIGEDGKMAAEEGMHDDRVMDAAIGKYCCRTLPRVKIQYVQPGAPIVRRGQGIHGQQRPDKKAYT